MGSLSEFQHGFKAALCASPAESEPFTGIASQPGFAVYRNTVMKGWIDALQANYPSVARLVGESWFRAAAALYVRKHPARDPRLLHYGAADDAPFSAFLADFEPAAGLPYLPDVARLDRLRGECHAAADANVLQACELAAMSPEQIGACVLQPHPAARWVWFDATAAYSIWCANNLVDRGDTGTATAAANIVWRAEGALLTRPADAVRWTALDAAGIAFLDACAGGCTLAEASMRALERTPQVDLAKLLATLLQAGAFAHASSTHS